MPGVSPLGQRYRGRVFVDYWNFTLSLKPLKVHRIDWKKLGPLLLRAAAQVVGDTEEVSYQGMNVYTSFDPRTDKGKGHRDWVEKTLRMFPGVSVSIVERRGLRSAPKCPSCHAKVKKCPSCDSDMRGTKEKGVDTRIATDMISLAWVNNYDIAVLASSDTDFVPVVKFLRTHGLKVIHVQFPRQGIQLTKECWGHINILDLIEEIS